MQFAFRAAAEMAKVLENKAESAHWQELLAELPNYALTADQALMVAPTLPYDESHRHFSHLMAIHPLGLIRWENGERDQSIIRSTIQLLEKVGPDWWCGYSYAWLANLKARAKDGNGAAEALRVFSRDFCSPNSFHLNGDQSKTGKSKFSYRPFTLEGNFAAAAGMQEMLLQSYAGFIEIMPAIPDDWQDVSFKQLRAEGAFLVSARRVNGFVDEVKIVAEQGGTTRLKLPFQRYTITSQRKAISQSKSDGVLDLVIAKGGHIILRRKV